MHGVSCRVSPCSACLGLWFLLPRVRRGLLQAEPAPLFSLRATQAAVASLAVLGVALLFSGGYEVGTPTALGTGTVNNATGDWANYGSSKSGTRYAASAQINLENIGQLERSWEIRTGVPGAFKGTPIQIDDGLFLCTGQNIILALDPDTGEERWRFDPELPVAEDWLLGYLPRRDLLRKPGGGPRDRVCRTHSHGNYRCAT